MMGRTHALTGTAAGLGASLYLAHLSLVPTVISTVVCTGSALLPDMDHKNATAANVYGPVTRAASWLVRTVSGGHRHGTHSLAGILILGAILEAGVLYRHTAWGAAILCTVLILALASAVRLLKIPGWFDDFAPIPLVIGIVAFTNVSLIIIPYVVMWGCFIHALGDCVTKEGVPWLWPVSSKNFKLALFTTNGFTERYVILPLVTLGIIVEVVWKVLDTVR